MHAAGQYWNKQSAGERHTYLRIRVSVDKAQIDVLNIWGIILIRWTCDAQVSAYVRKQLNKQSSFQKGALN